MLGSGAMTKAQDESQAISRTGDPLMLGLTVARDLVEGERDAPLRVVRWLYYEDDWSSLLSWRRYGAFGIDNCVADVPIVLKRTDVLFGWTFSIMDVSGKEYQARVSYDLEEAVLCDEVLVPPQYGGPVSAESQRKRPLRRQLRRHQRARRASRSAATSPASTRIRQR